jgi:hypothetical protein
VVAIEDTDQSQEKNLCALAAIAIAPWVRRMIALVATGKLVSHLITKRREARSRSARIENPKVCIQV